MIYISKYKTNNRQDIIELCEQFSEFVRKYISESEDRPVYIEIDGDYASGMSLIADSIKAVLLGKNVEDERWKHSDSEDGEMEGTPVSISFVNARFDYFNTIINRTLKIGHEEAAPPGRRTQKPDFS